MKKICKSRIFIVIICGIIFTSLGVYGATTKYKASEVLYNASNGDSITVNDALNELYNNMNKCSFTDKLRLGDYVSMTPTSTSYAILKESTGYSVDQTIDPSELNLWRIIKINEDGTIEIISEYTSSTNVYFSGLKGYLNYVGTLNTIANQYENSKYTIGSRIIGYNGQTEIITDTSKFTTTAPWTSNTSDNSNEVLGGGDVMYETDTNLVISALGTLETVTPAGTEASYWLGSRLYYYDASTYYRWFVRRISTIGSFGSNNLYSYRYGSGWSSNSGSDAIRPILTLKSGLIVKGSGIKDDPWVLE